MEEKFYLSKEKHKALKAELEKLVTITRKDISEKLSHARSLGDLSENAEYHEARNQQAEIESRVTHLQELLKTAEIVKAHHSDIAEVGSTVTLKNKKTSDKTTYQIVGTEEADIMEKKISVKSPLGSAMIGKTKKDEFSFETPKGKVNYVVVDIH